MYFFFFFLLERAFISLSVLLPSMMSIRQRNLVEQMLIVIYEMNLFPSAHIGMKCIWLLYIKVSYIPKCVSVHYPDF